MKMEVMECLGGDLDIMSKLHEDIITKKILCHLPVRDLVKTSILSRRWRHMWANTPVIVFNDADYPRLHYHNRKTEFMNAIFHVLLLHKGPLLDFTLSVEIDARKYYYNIHNHVDQIILYLSRTNTLKAFTLVNRTRFYRIPTCFILSLLKGLQRLCLTNCQFEIHHINQNQLSELTYLRIDNVCIYANTLKSILANCPLLKQLYLLKGGCGLPIVEFLECVPRSIEFLAISKHYFDYFVGYGMPHKLPVSLVHLKELNLGVFLKDHFSCMLRFIKSFPNLKKLNISLSHKHTCTYVLEDHLGGFELESVEEMEVSHFRNLAIEVEFLKLVIISKSSMLNKLIVLHSNNFTADEEKTIFDNLMQFQHSSSPKIIIKRYKL